MSIFCSGVARAKTLDVVIAAFRSTLLKLAKAVPVRTRSPSLPKTEAIGDGCRCRRVIAGDHRDVDAGRPAKMQCLLHSRTRWIDHRYQSEKGQFTLDVDGTWRIVHRSETPDRESENAIAVYSGGICGFFGGRLIEGPWPSSSS